MDSISLGQLARFSMLSNVSLHCCEMTFGCVRLSMSTHICIACKKLCNEMVAVDNAYCGKHEPG